MGCFQSRDRSYIQKEVELDSVMADSVTDPAPPPPPDPRLPLTALQVFKIKKSWKGIKRNIEATGVDMFIRLFKANKELLQLFSNFKHLKTDDDMRVDEMLERHATLVMGIFDEAISNIDNVDCVEDLLREKGKSHSRFNAFTADFFWAMEKPFLEAVKQTLGDRYTDNMDVIYKIVIRFILETMVKANKSVSSDQPSS